MNWKQIIRAAFDLTDEEWDQAVKLRALSETERELLTSALGPQKPAAKKSSKKAGKKSARAQSLSEQIKRGGTDRPLSVLCVASLPNGSGRCGHEEDDVLHHDQSYGNYHPFTPAASSAPPSSDQASSGIGKADVSSVVQRASGGD